MEHKPIRDLRVSSPAGLKVLIENVNVRHGCLMLVPEGLKVIGGMVEALEDERRKRTGCHQTIDISDGITSS
ncbi:hypothetical protein MKW92_025169 [Papaver armeniacum]|nr:hypothetical protein MKW92_025169 [Papaver armeniacum]